jgi:hypothetical protein
MKAHPPAGGRQGPSPQDMCVRFRDILIGGIQAQDVEHVAS